MSEHTVRNRFWLTSCAVAIALAWLLPNHYLPWLSFHADAWLSLMLLLLAGVVFVRVPTRLVVHRSGLVVLGLVLLPWLQVAAGLLTQTGVAWVVSSYLLGFLLAWIVGYQWETRAQGELGDVLFLAFGLAAVVSVGIQLYQCWGLQGLELWVAWSSSTRPSANLGQPNQLGTLLLWGVLASAWGWVRGYIGAKTAVFLAVFLLVGIALTASRTAWIGLCLLVCATWAWRAVWPSRYPPWVASGLAVYFIACTLSVVWLQHNVLYAGPAGASEVVRMSGELRPRAWAALLDAAGRAPWFGYGWGQTAQAQMVVAMQHPNLGHVFSYAHNLFIDLVVWCGIPLGVGMFLLLLAWLWQHVRAVRAPEVAILCMLLLVVGNHAMLEMPLYYAYFLLPVGLVLGALEARHKVAVCCTLPAWCGGLLALVCAVLLALIVCDYFKVEASYKELQTQWDNIHVAQPSEPPDTLLLTQWADYIRYVRMPAVPNMSAHDLRKLEQAVLLHPNLLIMHQLAMALALNQRTPEAQLWVQRMCKITSAEHCQSMKIYWDYWARDKPVMHTVTWPAVAAHRAQSTHE